MVFIPAPDFDGDLWTGAKVDLQNPPRHCSASMRVSEEPDGFRLDCHEDDYEIHVDGDGVLTEPPYTLDEGW